MTVLDETSAANAYADAGRSSRTAGTDGRGRQAEVRIAALAA